MQVSMNRANLTKRWNCWIYGEKWFRPNYSAFSCSSFAKLRSQNHNVWGNTVSEHSSNFHYPLNLKRKKEKEKRMEHHSLNDIRSHILSNRKSKILLASLRRQCGRQFAHQMFFEWKLEARAWHPKNQPTTPFSSSALEVGLSAWHFFWALLITTRNSFPDHRLFGTG